MVILRALKCFCLSFNTTNSANNIYFSRCNLNKGKVTQTPKKKISIKPEIPELILVGDGVRVTSHKYSL